MTASLQGLCDHKKKGPEGPKEEVRVLVAQKLDDFAVPDDSYASFEIQALLPGGNHGDPEIRILLALTIDRKHRHRPLECLQFQGFP